MEEAPDLQPLSEEEIKKRLAEYTGWEYKDNKLIKTFEFKDFSDGLNFLNKLIPFCNHIDHHPDLKISYRKWTFELTRFSVGGKVTARDFTVLTKIEEMYKNWPK